MLRDFQRAACRHGNPFPSISAAPGDGSAHYGVAIEPQESTGPWGGCGAEATEKGWPWPSGLCEQDEIGKRLCTPQPCASVSQSLRQQDGWAASEEPTRAFREASGGKVSAGDAANR